MARASPVRCSSDFLRNHGKVLSNRSGIRWDEIHLLPDFNQFTEKSIDQLSSIALVSREDEKAKNLMNSRLLRYGRDEDASTHCSHGHILPPFPFSLYHQSSTTFPALNSLELRGREAGINAHKRGFEIRSGWFLLELMQVTFGFSWRFPVKNVSSYFTSERFDRTGDINVLGQEESIEERGILGRREASRRLNPLLASASSPLS